MKNFKKLIGLSSALFLMGLQASASVKPLSLEGLQPVHQEQEMAFADFLTESDSSQDFQLKLNMDSLRTIEEDYEPEVSDVEFSASEKRRMIQRTITLPLDKLREVPTDFETSEAI